MTILREKYLKGLAHAYDATFETVLVLADSLGENEDRDGLITALEDLCGMDDMDDDDMGNLFDLRYYT